MFLDLRQRPINAGLWDVFIIVIRYNRPSI
jgi:hypothetical protein